MYSDWDFLNYNNNAYFGYNSPIDYNTSSFTGTSSNGTTVTSNVPVPAGAVANWVIFGNAMDYIFDYVQHNFNPNGSL